MPKTLNIENPLDKHLRKVKDSDDTVSAMSISSEEVEVDGNLRVTGSISNDELSNKHPLTTVGIANDNLVEIDDADAAEDECN